MARSKARRAVFVVLSALPLLAACNGIVGISDYQKAECSGGGNCLGDSSVVDGGGIDSSDADAHVTLIDAAGSDPVSWARWVMPNYAQPTQDAAPGVNIPTYGAGADGGLVDSISHLVWRPVTADDKARGDLTFANAQTFCKSQAGGPWRLPTRIELISLLDLSKSPAISDVAFGIEAKQYWTTSIGRESTSVGTRYVVGFDRAASNMIVKLPETSQARVVCIQGL